MLLHVVKLKQYLEAAVGNPDGKGILSYTKGQFGVLNQCLKDDFSNAKHI